MTYGNKKVGSYAGFPGNCYNGTAYPQTESKSGYPTTNTFTNTWAAPAGFTVENWLQYMWCPTYAGDSVGLNFTYSRVYPQNGSTYNCIDTDIGYHSGGWFGAVLHQASPDTMWYDDENPGTTYYNICSGNYVWDYSHPSSGAYQYRAEVWSLSCPPNTGNYDNHCNNTSGTMFQGITYAYNFQ